MFPVGILKDSEPIITNIDWKGFYETLIRTNFFIESEAYPLEVDRVL